MKFEKQLRAEIVPEWRTKYIDYSGLKKRLRYMQHSKLASEKELKELEQEEDNEVNVNNYNNPLHDIHQINSGSSTPFNNNNNRLFSMQSQQRTFSMNSAARSQQRTFSMTSLASSFFHRVSNALVSIQKQQNLHVPPLQPTVQPTSLEDLLKQVNPEERLFFIALDKELVKIEAFYESKEREASIRMKMLIKQYEVLKDERKKRRNTRDNYRKSKTFVDYVNSSKTQATDKSEKYASGIPGQFIDYKTARKRIKKALFEFYRGVEILRKYCTLNYTGFIKVLKKYDKISGRDGSKVYMKKVSSCSFVKSNVAKKLLKEIEDFYGNNFENGSRSQAMRKLRLPNKEHKSYYGSTLRVGFYLGLALPVLVHGLEKAREHPFETWLNLLQLYSALLLPVLLLLLIGVNMYVWVKTRINYKFIFELNPRDNLDLRQFLELPAIIFLVATYTMLIGFFNNFNYIQPYSYPIFFVIFAGAVIFNPFPILYYSSRKWFILSIARLFGSGILRVEFRDFFIADGLTSLSYSLSMLQLFGCRKGDGCNVSLSVWTPFLGSIPLCFRLLQCLKRYRDTGLSHHLINLFKYGTVIIATFMAYFFRVAHDHGNSFVALTVWVFVQAIASLYTFSWDVKMDWSLFKLHSINYLLRDELGYSYHWIYYTFIITNFILRWAWVLIVVWPAEPIVGFIVAFGEVIRRWMWNLIRVEYEHINNCENNRAIKDIALPFQKQIVDLISPEEVSVNITLDDQTEESDYDRTSSMSSWKTWKKLFAKQQQTGKHKMSSADSLRDFEPRNDVPEYLYEDIYEESEEDSLDENDLDDDDMNNSKKRSRGISLIKTDEDHGINNAYASRSFLPIAEDDS